MKIVYCLDSIRYLGGIQRVTIVKANALAEVQGNEVYIVVTDNKNGCSVHPLSDKVHLIDLDVNYYRDDWKSRWHVLKGIMLKRKAHKRKLSALLRQLEPDVVIACGQSEKYFLPSICGNWSTVREIHFTKNYRMLQARSFYDKIMAFCGDIYDYRYKIKRYDHIVVLTEEDKNTNWDEKLPLLVIPNPLSFQNETDSLLQEKKIMATGRLSFQKNYSSLIRVFGLVADKHPDWTLEIYGEGEERASLQKMIDELKLGSQILLKGYTSDVQSCMRQASCFVLSSLFEGFSLVIGEAMSCGLPVVSYACPCGPKDLITDGKDGFLIPPGDEKLFAEKISYLIEHEERRMEMGKAAKESANRYKIDNIVGCWMQLFNTLINSRSKHD